LVTSLPVLAEALDDELAAAVLDAARVRSNSEIRSGQSRFSSGSQVLSELNDKKSGNV
jgi:hypothetical protein